MTTTSMPIDERLELERIDVPAESPSLHLEVISEPHVDAPREDAGESELADAVVRRYCALRESFAERPCHVLVVRGRRSIEGAAVDEERVWEAALDGLKARAGRLMAIAPDGAGHNAALFDVHVEGGERIAVVALFAVPRTADAGVPAGRACERLVRRLATGEARNVPLYVIVVTGDPRPGTEFLTRCERFRASLVLAASEGRDDVVTVSRTLARPGQAATSVEIVPCPGFKPGSGFPGLTHVRLDSLKGEASLAFRHDLGSDQRPRAVQVLRRLISASRVSSSEQRLRHCVESLLRDAGEQESHFAREAEAQWDASGYAAVGHDGSPPPLVPTRDSSYNLLLLLRRRGEHYEILLSNHSPLHPSPLSDWNTLLLPAFKNARVLLEHLRDDVLRQAAERAEDFERAERARELEKAVQRILASPGNDLWDDEVREVAQTKIVKISPTTGSVTEFEYHLVTLLPFVDRSIARSPEGGAERHDRHRIIDWLDGLDAVRLPGEQPGPGIPAEALMDGGGALRWDPETGLAEEVDGAVRRRRTRAYPGAIWFPLVDHEGAPLWRACPAIMARNGDVLAWVTGILAAQTRDGRAMPDELQLGRFRGGSSRYEPERAFRFDEASEPVEGIPGTSTIDALRRVRFSADFDLRDAKPYESSDIRRAWLRRERAIEGEFPRDAIAVYEGYEDDPPEPDLDGRDRLGFLRPVQRYVLAAGLERAAELERDLRRHRDADPWGFLRVRKGGAPEAVSVTPPLVEELHLADRDDLMRDGDVRDFIVCDGNHRIVHGVWKQPGTLPAIAILAPIAEPYYAHPYGRLEWEATEATELKIAPDPAFKYLRRRVDPATHPPPPGKGEDDLYRRYFRDLESGFGRMGGQGGRFV